jgi:tetratricopeptide (TPR) repeat protein
MAAADAASNGTAAPAPSQPAPATATAGAATATAPPPTASAPPAQPRPMTLAEEEAAQVELEKKQERVAGLLTAAFALTEQSKYVEALPIAEEAVKLLPDSTSAHALLATLYEHTEQNAKAIRAMERVVALNPESDADQMKLDQLKRGVHVLPRPTMLPAKNENKLPTWAPALLAVGATSAVLGIGLYVVNLRQENPPPVAQPRYTQQQQPPTALAGSPTGTPTAAPQAPTMSDAKGYIAPPIDTREDPFAAAKGAPNAPASPAPVQASTAPGLSRLPAPGSRPTTATPAPSFVPPVTLTPQTTTKPPSNTLPPINVGATTSPTPNNDNGNGFGTGGRIPVGPPPAGGLAEPSNTSTPKPSSYIRIEVHPPSGGSSSGDTNNGGGGGNVPPPKSTPAPAPQADANPLTRARRLQSAGRYQDAVSAYKEALSSGSASSGDAQQGIAQCYQRIGDDSAARAAYRSALRAYEAQASSGRGEAAAQRGIASCKAALEVLGG